MEGSSSLDSLFSQVFVGFAVIQLLMLFHFIHFEYLHDKKDWARFWINQLKEPLAEES